jgi:hypothetical protein
MNTKNTSPRNLNENPESSTFSHKFERGDHQEKNHKGLMCASLTKTTEERPQIHQKEITKKKL